MLQNFIKRTILPTIIFSFFTPGWAPSAKSISFCSEKSVGSCESNSPTTPPRSIITINQVLEELFETEKLFRSIIEITEAEDQDRLIIESKMESALKRLTKKIVASDLSDANKNLLIKAQQKIPGRVKTINKRDENQNRLLQLGEIVIVVAGGVTIIGTIFVLKTMIDILQKIKTRLNSESVEDN